MYIIYNKINGNICYITPFQNQVFLDESIDSIEIEELPEWFNDITKKPIVRNKELIEDPTFIYLTPEEIELKNAKEDKVKEIKQEFINRIEQGYFLSLVLEIKVDCRRGGYNNDLQNVEGLIQFMEGASIEEITYKGYTEEVTATLSQLQQLRVEMIQYALNMYQKKWELETLVTNALTIEDVNNIQIDFN